MRRKLTAILSALVIISLSATTAFAGRITFTSMTIGSSTSGAFTIAASATSTETVTAEGTGVGLGNTNVEVILTATAEGTATCTNKGGNQAPGRNLVQVTTVSLPASVEVDDNGNFTFDLLTQASPPPPMPSPRLAGCPNANWSVAFVTVTFTSATIKVIDSVTGEILYEKTFPVPFSGRA